MTRGETPVAAGGAAGPHRVAVIVLLLAAAAAWGQHPDTSAASAPDAAGGTGMLVSSSVRFRSAPSTTASILTVGNAGTLVTILSRSERSEDLTGAGRFWWYNVQLADGRKAWVYGQFVWMLHDSPSSLSTPMPVTVGAEHYLVELFTPQGDSGREQAGEVTDAVVLAREGGGQAVPVVVDPGKAPHPNPDHLLVVVGTLDNGGEGVNSVETAGDGGIRIVVHSVNTHYSSDQGAEIIESFDTSYLCAYRSGSKGPVFEVTGVEEGKHTIEKGMGK